jgi:hypothetical protein
MIHQNKYSLKVDLAGVLLILQTEIILKSGRGSFKIACDQRAWSGGFNSHAVSPTSFYLIGFMNSICKSLQYKMLT